MERPKVVRYFGPLAEKIGPVRCVVLLQIEFWLYVQGKEIGGRKWVRVKEKQLAKDVGHSRSKVHRAIQWLYENNLVYVRQDLNKKQYDKTKWYSINPFGIEQLGAAWPGSENEITIPDYYYSNNNLNHSHTTARDNDSYHTAVRVTLDNVHKDVDDGSDIGDTSVDPIHFPSASQPALFKKAKRTRTRTHVNGPKEILPHQFNYMFELCYGAQNGDQARLLNSKQRGRAADALTTMVESGVDLNEIPMFKDWWKGQWMSRDRETRAYQRPRPDQVAEYWWASVADRPETEGHHSKKKEVDTTAIEEKIREFRVKRRRTTQTQEDDDDS